VRPGLDGLLDVARRTYSETVEDIQSMCVVLGWLTHRSIANQPCILGFSLGVFFLCVRVFFSSPALVSQLSEKYEVRSCMRSCSFVVMPIDNQPRATFQLPLKACCNSNRGWFVSFALKDTPVDLPPVFEQVQRYFGEMGFFF
jgi:hypothetical protein